MRNNGSSRLNRGFTLIETMVATSILLTGLVAVAYLFTYSIQTNMTTKQQTSATLLLTNKMEILRETPFLGLTNGGSVNIAAPVTHYWDYVTLSTSGAITSDTGSTHAPYRRLWQVSGTRTKFLSVVVYAQQLGIGGQLIELARASSAVTSGF